MHRLAQKLVLFTAPVFMTLLASGIAHAQSAANTAPASAADAPMATPGPLTLPDAPNTLPKWSEFPVAPTDVPTAAEFARRVKVANAKQVALESELRTLVWDDDQPDAFAAATRARINPAMTQPVDGPMTQAQIEALAASLRQRAVAPPVVN